MPIISAIEKKQNEVASWRQELHQRPETAFEEFWTSDFIASKLDEWNISHTRGWAKTGIVATIHSKNCSTKDQDKTIILRADMDALDITEQTGLSYCSQNHGKMHGCGHDGHSAMLMATAQYLSRNTDCFDGTVHLIFQPAEEGGAGASVMVEEGFFDKYPCKAIFGMHNWPALEKGKMSICTGAMTATADSFTMTITGKGGHAAMPHQNIDVITAASDLVMALQTIISRETDPMQGAVISVTRFQSKGSESLNVMPEYVELGGSVRCFGSEMRNMLEKRISEVAEHISKSFKCSVDVKYEHGYPSVVNTKEETMLALQAAKKTVGEANADDEFIPTMGAEDFAFFLEKSAGAYIALGQKDENKSASLHSSQYDFNDDVIPIGASYWVNLVKTALPT